MKRHQGEGVALEEKALRTKSSSVEEAQRRRSSLEEKDPRRGNLRGEGPEETDLA
jgi:hypothetical protein